LIGRSRRQTTDYHIVVGALNSGRNLRSVLNTNRRKQMNTVTFQESFLDKVGLTSLMIVAVMTVVGQIALLF